MTTNLLPNFKYQSTIRILIISILTILVAGFLFRPIYLAPSKSFGVICKFCQTPRANQLVAVRLAGESIVQQAKVVGLPEDQVAIKAGQLIINGNIHPQQLPKEFEYATRKNLTSEYFLLIYDQNSDIVSDYGRVKQQKISGVIYKLW